MDGVRVPVTDVVRRDYIQRVEARAMRIGWDWQDIEFVPRPYQPTHPHVTAISHLWKWADVGPLLREAGQVVEVGQGQGRAERRVLALVNPGLPGSYYMTQNFWGDLQFIAPGESAPCHRHTTSATRFIYEGQGGWSTIDGERVRVKPGDIMYAGNWSWHDHGNEGPDNFLFFDVLDNPLLNYLGGACWDFDYASITGSSGTTAQPAYKPSPRLPISSFGGARPTFVASGDRNPYYCSLFRLEDTRAYLNSLRHEVGSDTDGIRIEFLNPANRGPVSHTYAIYAHLLRPGEHLRTLRRTCTQVFVGVSGQVTIREGDQVMPLGQNDIAAVSTWRWYSLANEGTEDALFYCISDVAVAEKLGVFREQVRLDGQEIRDTDWMPSPWMRVR